MRMKPQGVIEARVPGTSRQRIKTSSGTILERQNVYLKPEAWEALEEMCREYNVSGSVVIARLIWEAAKYNGPKRQASE